MFESGFVKMFQTMYKSYNIVHVTTCSLRHLWMSWLKMWVLDVQIISGPLLSCICGCALYTAARDTSKYGEILCKTYFGFPTDFCSELLYASYLLRY